MTLKRLVKLNDVLLLLGGRSSRGLLSSGLLGVRLGGVGGSGSDSGKGGSSGDGGLAS